VVIFVLLLGLTVSTVAAAYVPFGAWHLPIALAIAAVKATLVVLFFMHLLQSARLNYVVVVSGLFWLGILLVLTFNDYLTRHWLSY
jgi:cytochrome c oxidase subunit 4